MGMLNGTQVANLVLRDLAIDQAEAFFDHIEENRDSYQDTIPFVSRTLTCDQMRENITRNLQRQEEGAAEFYTLWDGPQMAGYFLLVARETQARWAEIGYMLGSRWRGRHIALEVCRLLLEKIFVTEGLQKAVLHCHDENRASMALATKLGFQLEGRLRNHSAVNGKLRNMLCFGLLREEWHR